MPSTPKLNQPSLTADLVVAEGQQIGEASRRGGDQLLAETAVEQDGDLFTLWAWLGVSRTGGRPDGLVATPHVPGERSRRSPT